MVPHHWDHLRQEPATTCAIVGQLLPENDRVPRQQATAQQLPGPPATCVILGKRLQGKPLVQGEPARFSSSACPGMFALRGNPRVAAAREIPRHAATRAILGQRLFKNHRLPRQRARFSGSGCPRIPAPRRNLRDSRAASVRESPHPPATLAILRPAPGISKTEGNLWQGLPENHSTQRRPARVSGSGCPRTLTSRDNARGSRAAVAR